VIALYRSAEEIGVSPSVRAVLGFARALGLKFADHDAREWLRPFLEAARYRPMPRRAAPGHTSPHAIKEDAALRHDAPPPATATHAQEDELVSKSPPGGAPSAHAHTREDQQAQSPDPEPPEGGRSPAPGYAFADWFLTAAIASEVLGGHHALDRKAWIFGQLADANTLVMAYGDDLCKQKALALFRAVAKGEIRRGATIAALKSVWDFRELRLMRPVDGKTPIEGETPEWLRDLRAAEGQ
jgi:hypothetical protein